MVQAIQPAEGIFLSITKTRDGQEIITNDFTSFDGLSNEEIIELIETDNRLYKMESLRRKQIRRYKERNKAKIILIRLIKAL